MLMKVYIAGKITGDPGYKERFDRAAKEFDALGYVVLNPAQLPKGMSKADYMRICFSMIDSADQVVFIDAWQFSEGAKLEKAYCDYIGNGSIWRHSKMGVYMRTYLKIFNDLPLYMRLGKKRGFDVTLLAGQTPCGARLSECHSQGGKGSIWRTPKTGVHCVTYFKLFNYLSRYL